MVSVEPEEVCLVNRSHLSRRPSGGDDGKDRNLQDTGVRPTRLKGRSDSDVQGKRARADLECSRI